MDRMRELRPTNTTTPAQVGVSTVSYSYANNQLVAVTSSQYAANGITLVGAALTGYTYNSNGSIATADSVEDGPNGLPAAFDNTTLSYSTTTGLLTSASTNELDADSILVDTYATSYVYSGDQLQTDTTTERHASGTLVATYTTSFDYTSSGSVYYIATSQTNAANVVTESYDSDFVYGSNGSLEFSYFTVVWYNAAGSPVSSFENDFSDSGALLESFSGSWFYSASSSSSSSTTNSTFIYYNANGSINNTVAFDYSGSNVELDQYDTNYYYYTDGSLETIDTYEKIPSSAVIAQFITSYPDSPSSPPTSSSSLEELANGALFDSAVTYYSLSGGTLDGELTELDNAAGTRVGNYSSEAIETSAGVASTATVAAFSGTDSNADDYYAAIYWGDGTESIGTISANGAGGFNVSGSHSYAEAGTYLVEVPITNGNDEEVERRKRRDRRAESFQEHCCALGYVGPGRRHRRRAADYGRWRRQSGAKRRTKCRLQPEQWGRNFRCRNRQRRWHLRNHVYADEIGLECHHGVDRRTDTHLDRSAQRHPRHREHGPDNGFGARYGWPRRTRPA